MKKTTRVTKKVEDAYVGFAENPSIMWFRGVLQSLDVEFTPDVGLKISLGQFLERFIFTQAEVIAQKRAQDAIENLNKKLKKTQIDQKSIAKKTEEHAKLFLRFYGAVGSQSFEELRNAYVNQLANFFKSRYSDLENKQFYQQLLFRLSIDHLAVLTFSEKYLGPDKSTQFENSKSLIEALVKEFNEKKNMSDALLRGIIKDLDSMGLLNDWQASAIGGDIHGLSLTDLGRQLLLQINEKEEAKK
jgi:hypothetical protein